MFDLLFDPLISLIFPQECGSCGRNVERIADGAACSDCWASTTLFSDPDAVCGKCGLFHAGKPAAAGSLCRGCGDHAYDIARSAGLYEKALQASVLRLKSEPAVSRTVRRHLLDSFHRLDVPPGTLVVPVPLSKARQLERGFNQAEVLAKTIAANAGLQLDSHTLVREKHTAVHRAGMDRKARARSVKKAFRVARPALIEGRDILLVDDLMTSGSTASECAAALKGNGAGRVFVLTLARAVLRR